MTRSREARARHAPRFPGNGPTLVTTSREAAVSVTRFAPTDFGPGLVVGMQPEDAYIVLFQLREHPAHDFWIGERYAPAEAVPSATLSIFDLADEPRGRLTDPVDTLMFHVPRTLLDEMTDDAGAARIGALRAPAGWRTHDAVIARMQGLIVDALADPAPGNQLLQDHLMLGITAHLAHAYGGMRPASGLRRGGLAPWQENRAKALIEANLTRQLSLEAIAAECQLSLSHFSRAFKVSTGTTPHEWLQTQRIAHAKDFLLSSGCSLAEVAVSCGFSDQSHFTRVFTRLVGVGPALGGDCASADNRGTSVPFEAIGERRKRSCAGQNARFERQKAGIWRWSVCYPLIFFTRFVKTLILMKK